MKFFIMLRARWATIRWKDLFSSSFYECKAFAKFIALRNFISDLITSFFEILFPEKSDILQDEDSYPKRNNYSGHQGSKDTGRLSPTPSPSKDGYTSANKLSGTLIPYSTSDNTDFNVSDNALIFAGTLYGYEPTKWRAQANKTRLTRSFKPIETIRKKRIYLRHYNNDMVITSRDSKSIFKHCKNSSMDLTYRFVYPYSANKVSISQEYLIYSPLVSHVEIFVDSHSDKLAKEIVVHQLKKLKKVKACFVQLGAPERLKFINRWKTLDSLRIKCGSEWTVTHWNYLSKILKPNLSSLSLNVRLMIESIKGEEYIRCLDKVGQSSIETLNLKLELQSEYIIDYLFVRCLCLGKIKNLHLRCLGNTVMTDHGVLTYEFQGLLNHLIPKSLNTMNSLTKLKLDFSNDFFVYYRMEDYQLIRLCEALQGLPHLSFLDLNLSNGCERANHVADSTLGYLETSFNKLLRLQVFKLNISNTFVTCVGLEKFCKFAMCLSNLHYFKINASRNSISRKKMEEALLFVKDQVVIYCDIIV